ncbi:hypothetical protein B0H63DRAFT_78754 [Podospora didyma]|uniref:Uncharacterized protein n=1 Tax=Podospora didyma TaxID=330526 RepID=A0AAE0K1Y4_9PEZI|nr:hypothetical protein B0H63DRAFT_78754 [Podospora didyma]
MQALVDAQSDLDARRCLGLAYQTPDPFDALIYERSFWGVDVLYRNMGVDLRYNELYHTTWFIVLDVSVTFLVALANAELRRSVQPGRNTNVPRPGGGRSVKGGRESDADDLDANSSKLLLVGVGDPEVGNLRGIPAYEAVGSDTPNAKNFMESLNAFLFRNHPDNVDVKDLSPSKAILPGSTEILRLHGDDSYRLARDKWLLKMGYGVQVEDWHGSIWDEGPKESKV